MRRRIEIAFALTLAAVFGWAAWEATHWSPRANLFPLAIAIPALALAVLQTALSVRGAAPAPATEGDLAPEVRARRMVEIGGWMAGLVAGLALIGFLATIPLVSFLYLRLGAREGWLISAAIAAGSWAFVYGLFDRALHVPLPPGPLLRLLGLG
ncbi:MAG: tripartite tricarboxylate transporter TctB family protein [Candidatus Limnocylindria bacterium]